MVIRIILAAIAVGVTAIWPRARLSAAGVLGSGCALGALRRRPRRPGRRAGDGSDARLPHDRAGRCVRWRSEPGCREWAAGGLARPGAGEHSQALRAGLSRLRTAHLHRVARRRRRPHGPRGASARAPVSSAIRTVLPRRGRRRERGLARGSAREPDESRRHEPARPLAGVVPGAPVPTRRVRRVPLRARSGPPARPASLRRHLGGGRPGRSGPLLRPLADRGATGRARRRARRARAVADAAWWRARDPAHGRGGSGVPRPRSRTTSRSAQVSPRSPAPALAPTRLSSG